MRNVLHLLDTTGPGGAETIFTTLVTNLDGSSWRSIPVVQGPGWVEATLRRAGRTPLTVTSSKPADLGYLRRLRRVIREQQVDLVHAHLSTTALYGGMAARLEGVPSVCTLHGTPDLRSSGLLGHLRHRLVRSTNYRVVFVSRSLRDDAVRRSLVNPEQTEVIHNGVDVDLFRPGPRPNLAKQLGKAEGQLLVVSVGNLRLLKDYPTLLETVAVAESIRPGRLQFVVVGDTESPLYERLLALRKRLGLEERVRFLGFREDVEEILRAADIFLLSSSREGFSLVTVQAMASGLAVVATRSGGPEEIITDGVDGLLCPPGDPESLARALLTLADSDDRPSIGRRARETAVQRFSIGAMVAAYDRLYREAVARP